LITILSYYRLIRQETPCFRQSYDRKVYFHFFFFIYIILNKIYKVKIIVNILHLIAILPNGYNIILLIYSKVFVIAFTSNTLFMVNICDRHHNLYLFLSRRIFGKNFASPKRTKAQKFIFSKNLFILQRGLTAITCYDGHKNKC